MVTAKRLWYKLWELSYDATTANDYNKLAEQREYLSVEPLIQWGLAKSIITGDWLVPGYNSKGVLVNLYRYVVTKNRKVLMPMPETGHGLSGINIYKKNSSTVYLCEGVWDGMALWEVLSRAKPTDDGDYNPTGNIKSSLLKDSCVISTPGCNIFTNKWSRLFSDKQVILMCQNDHERTNPKTQKPIPPASWRGMQRVAGILSNSQKPPAEILVLQWGTDGYTTSQPHGHDIRDALCLA